MNVKSLLAVGAALFGCSFALQAAVAEFNGVVPDAAEYETIYKLDAVKYNKNDYITDNSLSFQGKLTKLAYYFKLTDKKGNVTWAFASMDPFTQDLADVGVPGKSIQQVVNNLEVLSNVPGVEKGKFAAGYIEFTPFTYVGTKTNKIPNGTNKFDVNDKFTNTGSYGCMQIHNHLKEQTVIAFNHFYSYMPEFGIGNDPNPQKQPDWTFARNCSQYKSAELIVAGKFENLKKRNIFPLTLKKSPSLVLLLPQPQKSKQVKRLSLPLPWISAVRNTMMQTRIILHGNVLAMMA